MIYVRGPNHLGDGVMARAAIAALARVAPVVVGAPAWGAQLYRDLGVSVRPRGEVPAAEAAALLAPSFRAAWECRRIPRRVGIPGDWRRVLLTDPVPAGGHRAEEYARIARRLGAEVGEAPPFKATLEEGLGVEVPRGHLALAPISPSGETVMWPHYQELAARWEGPVVVYVGPGEDFPGGLPVQRLPLGELAAALERASALVANDSGLSHFGRAVGVPTVVVHGSTDPARTGARGSRAVTGPPLPCAPCYKKRCRVGGVPCLGTPVETVLSAVHEIAR